MPAKKQNVFFISDSTGITIESLGLSLFAQFPDTEFVKTIFPFVSDAQEARRVIAHISAIMDAEPNSPIVFTSLADKSLTSLFLSHDIPVLDIFSTFIPLLESRLGTKASHTVGETHGVGSPLKYVQRNEALDFTLNHDDGTKISDLENADIVLTGVSRSGKTPTCLYLAMHYNLKAANYPLADADFESTALPRAIAGVRSRLFGLTLSPGKLHKIRQERKPSSRYSSLEQCEYEIRRAESIFRAANLPFLDSTSISIEEITTAILQRLRLGTPTKQQWSPNVPDSINVKGTCTVQMCGCQPALLKSVNVPHPLNTGQPLLISRKTTLP